jgi:hypothetical protein
MKTYLMSALLALLACPAMATLSTDAYLSDGNTPLLLRDPNVPHVYRDVMVGTKLSIIVSSDNSKVRAKGVMSMLRNDWAKGELTARYPIGVDLNWDGSCFDAAGHEASVTRVRDSSILMYWLYSGDAYVRPGRWFILDYQATSVGSTQITMSDYTVSNANPILTNLTFNHVPSRDFNGDTVVNLKDFALLAAQWRTNVIPDPNDTSTPFDFDMNGYVGPQDLASFCSFWLDRTDVNAPVPDPNAPSAPLAP